MASVTYNGMTKAQLEALECVQKERAKPNPFCGKNATRQKKRVEKLMADYGITTHAAYDLIEDDTMQPDDLHSKIDKALYAYARYCSEYGAYRKKTRALHASHVIKDYIKAQRLHKRSEIIQDSEDEDDQDEAMADEDQDNRDNEERNPAARVGGGSFLERARRPRGPRPPRSFFSPQQPPVPRPQPPALPQPPAPISQPPALPQPPATRPQLAPPADDNPRLLNPQAQRVLELAGTLRTVTPTVHNMVAIRQVWQTLIPQEEGWNKSSMDAFNNGTVLAYYSSEDGGGRQAFRQIHGSKTVIPGTFDLGPPSTTTTNVHERPVLLHHNVHRLEIPKGKIVAVRGDDRGILIVELDGATFRFRLVNNPHGMSGHYAVKNGQYIPITSQTFYQMLFILPEKEDGLRPICITPRCKNSKHASR